MSSSGAALARCVDISAEDFATDHWGRRPLLSHHDEGFADLLSLDDVDELLSRRGLRSPFIRMAKDGTVLPTTAYTGGGGIGAEVRDQVHDEKVFDLLADGATLVLQGLHRLWPPLIDFAVALRGDTGTPVQVNAYLTPPGNRGFATHYDTHAVFVLQVAGRKHWHVHPPVVTDPIERQPWGGLADEVSAQAEQPAAIDTVLTPGDALYLPRGWLHSADALDVQSLHLTLGLRAPTRFTVIESLLQLAATEPTLRADLPMGVDITDPDALSTAVKALQSWLDRVTPDALTAPVAARPAPMRPVAQAAALAALTADTVIIARRGLDARITTDGATLTVHLPDKRVTFPTSCSSGVRAVLAGSAVRIGDLPGLPDDHDRLVLARRLLREAMAVI